MKSILFCTFLLIPIALYPQERRMALVIGNSTYKHIGELKNPVSDAYLMGFTLEDLGFDVMSVTNVARKEMEGAADNFLNKLTTNDLALIYYTGHGLQADGQNYLVPVDAKLSDKKSIKKEAFNINEMISRYAQISGMVKIFILDACREDAFLSRTGEETKGFAEMAAPAGSLIAFSTSPGEVASEADGANGLFAENLTRQMMVPQYIEGLFKNTGLLVSHSSRGQQIPVFRSGLDGEFSLIEGKSIPSTGNGSIMINSKIAGNLFLNGIEITSVEPNSVVPLDNMQEGTYDLKIEGEETWEENVLVLGDQITNVTADAVMKEAIPIEEKESQVEDRRPGLDEGDVYTDLRDQAEYPFMKFGDQIWMTTNLSYDAPAGSYCYENNTSDCDTYGRLYTWEAALQACPDGWHLPSDEEWKELERFIGIPGKKARRMGLRGKTEGSILKDASQGLWSSADRDSDSNGFNALPGGFNLSEKRFTEKGKTAFFWTSTNYNNESAFYRKLDDSKGGIHRYYNNKKRGYSVRCVRD